jgi:hypothetical protein
VILEYGELWWNDINRRKLLLRPPEVSDNSNFRVFEERSRRNMAKDMLNFAYEVSLS